MKKIYFLIYFLICLVGVCNAQYTKLLDFAGANGILPKSSLTSGGTFFYGMTYYGGANNDGTLFKIKPDGTGYSKLLDFTGVNGQEPSGSLIFDGTFLYGMTALGGTIGYGVVFKIKPDGTGYADLLDFAGITNGGGPAGSLMSDGTYLYGMTFGGGTNGYGTIFKIKSDGTGYSNLFNFANDTVHGYHPTGSLIYDGTFLYGMTRDGGTNGFGIVFKIKSDGTGYVDLLDFTGAANGGHPTGSLIFDGNFLYGMTSDWNTNNDGTIFKIKPDGTGYVDLLDFSGGTNGGGPAGSLISDGTSLYGMTYYGGANNDGTTFKIKPDGTGYSKLLDFSGAATGSSPEGDLISDGTFLYGMTAAGGTNNMGTMFKYALVTDIAENNAAKDFTIFPNPSTGKFTIESAEKISFIKIINLLGEKIFTSSINHQTSTIDLSSQPKGIYFIEMICGEQRQSKRIVLQ